MTDGDNIFLSDETGGKIFRLSLKGEIEAAYVSREPVAVTVAGNNVYVACHLPNEDTDNKVMGADLAVIETFSDKVIKTLPLVNGSSGVKDICASPDGKTVYVSHIVGRYAYPTTQLNRAWINFNCVSVVDTKSQAITCSVLLDEVDKGAANPWSVTVSADGKYLCVALSGLDEVMLVDRAKMHSRIDDVVNKKSSVLVSSPDVIVDYLPFLNTVKNVEYIVGCDLLYDYNLSCYSV